MTAPNPFAAFTAQTPAQNPAAAFGPPPGAAPAPTGFGPAPAQSGFGPAPALAPAPIAAPAPGGFGVGMPSVDDVTEQSARLPSVPEGTHLVEFIKNECLTQQGHTVRLTYKVIETNNPNAAPVGSETVTVDKIPAEQKKRGKALGRILAQNRALMGFQNEEQYKAASPGVWQQVLQLSLAGQPLTPLVGKKIWILGTRGDQKKDKDTGLPVPGEFWVNLQFAPA